MTWLSIPVALRDSILDAVRAVLESDERVTMGLIAERVSAINATVNQYPSAIMDALDHLVSIGAAQETSDNGLIFYSIRRAA